MRLFTPLVSIATALSAMGALTISVPDGSTKQACSNPLPSRKGRLIGLTASPGHLIASNQNGDVWIGNEDGSQWRRSTNRAPGRVFTSLEPGSYLMAAATKGLWASRDLGKTWTAWSCDWIVTGAAESRPNTMFVATVPDERSGRGGGLYQTSDGGKTWKLLSSVGSRQVNVLLVPPFARSTMYVATEAGGVLSSDDGGTQWKRTLTGRGRDRGPILPTSLALGGGPHPVLWAGTRRDGVFRSSTKPSEWLHAGLAGRYIGSVVPDPNRPNVVHVLTYNGLLQTRDGGHTWHEVQGPVGSATDVYQASGRIFATVGNVVFRSLDHGITWRRVVRLR